VSLLKIKISSKNVRENPQYINEMHDSISEITNKISPQATLRGGI
jgi:hypothetical protein